MSCTLNTKRRQIQNLSPMFYPLFIHYLSLTKMNFTLPSIPSAIPEKFLYSLDASRSSFALSRSASMSPSNTLTSFSIPSSLNWIIPLFSSAAPESSCSTPDTNAPVLLWREHRYLPGLQVHLFHLRLHLTQLLHLQPV